MEKTTVDALAAVRDRGPAVHCITNSVAQNFTANVLLALGATPSMTHDADEVAEFVASSEALLINLGTLDPARRRSIDLAITSAENTAIPWVLDPVMIDRSHRRAESAAQYLLRKPTVMRANEREAELMAGSLDEADLRAFAEQAGIILTVTGPVDRVVDAQGISTCAKGTPLMHRVTAFGCALSSVMAAFLAVVPDRHQAVLAALETVGEAGEQAAAISRGPGTFPAAFLDTIASL